MRRLAVVLLVLLAAPAWAQLDSVKADAEATEIYRLVMSPFCPGLTLADCPSPNAFAMRRDIEARLKNGESKDAIVNELLTKYGAQILADPSDTPIGAVVWGVPIAFSIMAAGGLAFFLRRSTRAGDAQAATHPAESREMRDRVDEELAALD